MKTTVHISDGLFKKAQTLAQTKGTTLKALVEEGLRIVVAGHEKHSSFKLRKASFKGKGLQRGLDETSWERIRDLSYEGRGS